MGSNSQRVDTRGLLERIVSERSICRERDELVEFVELDLLLNVCLERCLANHLLSVMSLDSLVGTRLLELAC